MLLVKVGCEISPVGLIARFHKTTSSRNAIRHDWTFRTAVSNALLVQTPAGE